VESQHQQLEVGVASEQQSTKLIVAQFAHTESGSAPDGHQLTNQAVQLAPPGELLHTDSAQRSVAADSEMKMMLGSASTADGEPLDGSSGVSVDHLERTTRLIAHRFVLSVLLFLMSPLLFDIGWTDLNADWCVNSVDEKITTSTNLVNFGRVTPRSCGSLTWVVSPRRLKYAVCRLLKVIL